jgi:hypothetical protein
LVGGGIVFFVVLGRTGNYFYAMEFVEGKSLQNHQMLGPARGKVWRSKSRRKSPPLWLRCTS